MQTTPFLMFAGAAYEAMSLYVALFPHSQILSLERYGSDAGEREGTVKLAEFSLNGVRYRCIDSPVVHPFTFTPAFSIFVDCDNRADFDRALATLRVDGQFLMAPANYGFSPWFTWLQDRFGVSWQLNLLR